jgi:hypothetical protein
LSRSAWSAPLFLLDLLGPLDLLSLVGVLGLVGLVGVLISGGGYRIRSATGSHTSGALGGLRS